MLLFSPFLPQTDNCGSYQATSVATVVGKASSDEQHTRGVSGALHLTWGLLLLLIGPAWAQAPLPLQPFTVTIQQPRDVAATGIFNLKNESPLVPSTRIDLEVAPPPGMEVYVNGFKVPSVAPPVVTTWTKCADEDGVCTVPQLADVRYGANGTYVIKPSITGSVPCSNAAFTDPLPGVVKACEYLIAPPPMPPAAILATFLGAPGDDKASGSPTAPAVPNGTPDWRLKVENVGGIPVGFVIRGQTSGEWVTVPNPTNWLAVAQQTGSTWDLWFEPCPVKWCPVITGFTVDLLWADGTKTSVNAALAAPIVRAP